MEGNIKGEATFIDVFSFLFFFGLLPLGCLNM